MRVRRWGILFAVAILLGIVVTRFPRGQHAVQTVIRPIARPFDWVVGGVVRPVWYAVTSLTRVATLSRRVQDLEGEVARLQAEQARAESIAQENTTLRNALELRSTTPFRLLAADVIGVTTDGTTTTLRINRGTHHGLSAGQPILAPGGVIIGRIKDAGWMDSTVDLLTGGAVRVSVRSLGTAAEGVVRGVRGLEVLLEGVPRTQELRTGDTLISTGIDGVFPPHLLVGTVGEVRAPENAVFQEAGVGIPVNPRAVRVVEVLLES